MRYLLLYFTLLTFSCGAPNVHEVEVEVLDAYEEKGDLPLTEELPDSGILKGVDPEQIITDDWSDDGDIELEVEEK